jgi:hypothetical protein
LKKNNTRVPRAWRVVRFGIEVRTQSKKKHGRRRRHTPHYPTLTLKEAHIPHAHSQVLSFFFATALELSLAYPDPGCEKFDQYDKCLSFTNARFFSTEKRRMCKWECDSCSYSKPKDDDLFSTEHFFVLFIAFALLLLLLRVFDFAFETTLTLSPLKPAFGYEDDEGEPMSILLFEENSSSSSSSDEEEDEDDDLEDTGGTSSPPSP